MYAVIRASGKQYRVTPNAVLAVDRIEAEPGQTVTFGEVLMVGGADGVKIGAPLLNGVSVAATVLETARAWAGLALTRLIGPREPYVALAWSWTEDLGVGLVFTTAAVALYAAAGHRVLAARVTGPGTPPAADRSHRRALPEP